MLIISLQNIAVKWIGGDYPILEIVASRSLVALPFALLLYRYEGNRGWPRTQQHRLEIIRGTLLFLSYTTHMMGLAALPLADLESIRFSGPLPITVLVGRDPKRASWTPPLAGAGRRLCWGVDRDQARIGLIV
jgi:drug/metabolite transporter (DMT)-like permease